MAGTLTISTLSDGTNSTSATNCIQGSAKAWVNFNGASGASPTIRASYNVSSVTRNSTGNYTVSFTNAFANVNFVIAGSVQYLNSGSETSGTGYLAIKNGTSMVTTSSVKFNTGFDGAINLDCDVVNVTVFSS